MSPASLSGNWALSPLRDVLALCDSGVWGSEAGTEQDFPVLRSTNVQDGKLHLEEVAFRRGIQNPERFILRTGDIIVTKSSGSKQLVGKCCVFSEPRDGRKYLFSNFVQRLRTNNRMLPDFLFYFLNSSWGKRNLARLHETTSGLRNLDTNRYLQQEVPVPPIAVQQGIVAVLKQADTLRQKREQANQLTSKIIQSVFLKMFGDPATNPMGWRTESLRLVLQDKLLHGKSLIREKVRPEPPGTFVLKLSALTDDGLDPSQIKYYDDPLVDRRWILEDDDILVSRSNTIEFVGRVGRYEGRPHQCIFPDLMIRVRPKRVIVEPAYLELYLRTRYVRDFFRGRARGTSGSMPKISNKDIEEVEVRIPHMELQRKFISVVNEIRVLRDKQQLSSQEINELFHSIMHKAFRGELAATASK